MANAKLKHVVYCEDGVCNLPGGEAGLQEACDMFWPQMNSEVLKSETPCSREGEDWMVGAPGRQGVLTGWEGLCRQSGRPEPSAGTGSRER